MEKRNRSLRNEAGAFLHSITQDDADKLVNTGRAIKVERRIYQLTPGPRPSNSAKSQTGITQADMEAVANDPLPEADYWSCLRRSFTKIQRWSGSVGEGSKSNRS
jgi:hypothetical protein